MCRLGCFATSLPNLIGYMVLSACLIQRCFRGKSRNIHGIHFDPPLNWLGSTVIIRRQLSDQERKLLGHVYPHEELLSKVGVTVGVNEDHLDNPASAAQRRGEHFHPGQRKISPKFLGSRS